MERLIKLYIKNQNKKNLHKLRIGCRRRLSLLYNENKEDSGCAKILEVSSLLRDTDVLLEICKNRKIKKFLKKRRKTLNKKFLKHLKNIKFKIVKKNKQEKTDLRLCKKLLNKSFKNKNDKTLHLLRLKIKICRYSNKKYEKTFKKIQTLLGKSHDLHKCEKLTVFFNKKAENIKRKKLKYIKKAEKKRKKALSILP